MSSSGIKDLKARIEKVLSEGQHDFTELELDKLIETANVYHVELEYQNEELRRIQNELEQSKARYSALFKDAPVGYVICDENAEIETSNNTFLSLIAKKTITKSEKFSNFIDPDSQDYFYLFFKSLIKNKQADSIEIYLLKGEEKIPVKLEANIFHDQEKFLVRLAISDLTTQKSYELQLENKSWLLQERLKELNCIFEITRLTGLSRRSKKEVFNKTIEIIPDSFQFPDITVAKIQYRQKTYQSENFDNHRHIITSQIIVDEEVVGFIQVGIIEDVPGKSDSFLIEERRMIESIAEILSKFLRRHKAELLLKQNEIQLNKAQEIGKTGSWVFNLDTNEVTASKEAYNIYGQNPDATFTIEKAQKFPLPEYREMLDKKLENLINKNEAYDVEFKIKQPSGNIIDIHSIAQYDAESNIVTGFIQDITEREKAKKELEEKEQYYRELMHALHEDIIVIDKDFNITDINESALKTYNINRQEALGKTCYEIIHKNERPCEEKTCGLKEVFKTGKAMSHTMEFENPEGKKIHLDMIFSPLKDEKGNVVNVIEASRDISETKKAMQRNKLLSRTIEQNPVAIVITDEQGNIDYVNPAFSSITGYSVDEVIGLNPRILNSGYQDKEFYQDLWNTILSGKDWFGIMKNKKKNGEYYWEEAIISPILDDNDQITHFVAVKEDISERKILMEDLVKAKEKAEESDRLKSAFLANMSHEIRTPMNGILGFTNLLKNPDLSSEKKDKFIDIIHKSGERMLNTVNDIVEISKIEAGLVTTNFEDVNVLSKVEEIIQFFKPEARDKGIILDLSVKGNMNESFQMITDPRKFDGILINLIKNAIKFTKIGGVTIGMQVHKNELQVYIRDTGIGIPKSRQKAIFNRFEQAENSETRKFEGSGLGLAISTSYVELLNGKIWLESEEGEGTTFYFTLPVSQPSN